MQKNIDFAILFFQTFLEKHTKHIIWSCLLGFFVTILFVKVYPLYIEFIGQKHVRIGIIGRYNDKSLPLYVQNQISFGLTSLNEAGEAKPSLAKSWEITDNGNSYIFHLLSDLTWHDGQKFTSQDITYKLQGSTFKPIDDFSLKITLKEPYAPLPILLSQPIFRPNLVGLGLYKVIRLTRKDNLLSEMTLQSQEKGHPDITYKFYTTSDEAILAFKLGEIDKILELTSSSDFKNWKGANISSTTLYDRFVGVFFNLKNPLFKDKEIRQALAYAIPKFEEEEKAYSPISPLSWAYYKKIKIYNQDFEGARKVLAKSSLSTPSSNLTLSTYASLLPQAQAIADAWSKAGVSVKIKVENSIPSDYQIFLLAVAIPADPDQYQYWQSTQEETNISHYSNPKIDKLLEDGRKTNDRSSREKIYADFQRYLVDDCPVIFLYYPKIYTVERG